MHRRNAPVCNSTAFFGSVCGDQTFAFGKRSKHKNSSYNDKPRILLSVIYADFVTGCVCLWDVFVVDICVCEMCLKYVSLCLEVCVCVYKMCAFVRSVCVCVQRCVCVSVFIRCVFVRCVRERCAFVRFVPVFVRYVSL